MNYILGVIFAISAGLSNFLGQILQKKAINDLKKEKDTFSMKELIKRPLWIFGMAMIIVFSTAFLTVAQIFIGPALIPGLLASGFIVLAIGSVKLLGEQLKKEEYIAIGLLIAGIVLISLSKLSIEPDILRFRNTDFVIRISAVTLLMLILWYSFFYGGKKSKKKTILMALGAGFPFALANIWMQPFISSIGMFFSESITAFSVIMLIVTCILISYTNIAGIIHLQKSMAEGNASIVIPIQQIPQQITPIVIYFFIYALSAPNTISYFYLIGGIALATAAGFILSRRQSELESKFAVGEANGNS